MIKAEFTYTVTIDEEALMKSGDFSGESIGEKISDFYMNSELDLGYPEFVKSIQLRKVEQENLDV